MSGIVRISKYAHVNYFLIFVDDFSRYINVFLLSRKNQVADAFEQYDNWIKRQFDLEIKRLRSDNGTEFKNSKMDKLTIKEGIIRHYTVHGYPEQNARAERVMRSIADIARSLLKQANISIRFWPYAVLFSVFIKNRTPHVALNFKTQMFTLFKTHCNYDKLLKFGTIIYAITTEYKTKFKDKSKKAIFLGYPENVKGYYAFIIEDDKVDTVRDIYIADQSDIKLKGNAHLHELDDEFTLNDMQYAMLKRLFEIENEATIDNVNESLQYANEEDEDFESCGSNFDTNSDSRIDENVAEDSINEIQLNSNENSATIDQSNVNVTVQDSTNVNSPNDLLFYEELNMNEQPKDVRIVMNKNQKAIFKDQFPNALFAHIAPYASGDKRAKMNIWYVNMVQAPRSYNEAVKGRDTSLWKTAMEREISSHLENFTFTLVPRPVNIRLLPSFWLYKYIYAETGLIIDGKARLVVAGNSQFKGLYELNYAPVVNWLSIRLMLSIAAKNKMCIHHMDCKTAFLNAPITGDVYTIQPPGYKVAGKEHYVLKLNKSIYGLRSSAKSWYCTLRKFSKSSALGNCLQIRVFILSMKIII